MEHKLKLISGAGIPEDVMYRLYFRRRVERGLKELDEGRTVTHAEVERSVAKWLRSAGR